MSELNTSRHYWSWRSCFATVKYNKKKSKKQQNHQSNLQTFLNGHTHNKHLQTVEKNANILSDFNLSLENTKSNEYNQNLISNDDAVKNEMSSNDNENNSSNNDNMQQVVDTINLKMVNKKSSSSIARSTQLDAIVEDSSEENVDEFDEPIQSTRLCIEHELVNDLNILHSRLYDLSKMNHIIILFNDNGYFLGEFMNQLNKLKLKIDDVKRTSNEMPRDSELLEAKYSTLLATVECLSLLLKIAQITSSRSFINRLISSIEQRIEQLNKLVQLSSSINTRQKQLDLIDDDLISFRSAFSSYEHLLTIPS
ncbi:unnamed protein product [Adineta steineri]|uniref:Uncharacterized protein n=1 Tax=Adineta steineri TaxID=433720 RepID=A0A815PBQ9_9BILA|nr:unnamed protein product [Adineta steineri]CAF3536880.1 unnamed protein product [Adineta steineri]